MMHHSVQEGEIEFGVDRELNTGPQLGVWVLPNSTKVNVGSLAKLNAVSAASYPRCISPVTGVTGPDRQ
jgi:hypothetical protein